VSRQLRQDASMRANVHARAKTNSIVAGTPPGRGVLGCVRAPGLDMDMAAFLYDEAMTSDDRACRRPEASAISILNSCKTTPINDMFSRHSLELFHTQICSPPPSHLLVLSYIPAAPAHHLASALMAGE